VVVVDDSPDSAEAMAMLVATLGYDARVAYDGESGVDLVREFQPRVVLLDIGLPGIDGYEACRRIREDLGAAVIVVALTGYGRREDKQAAQSAGFDAYLTKPADLQELERLLQDATGRR
jgi:CheY-like chemotaxis protein